MSRFFEQTKKARDWSVATAAASDLDLKDVVEAMREANSAAPNVPATRFASARKITIPGNGDSRLLSRQYVSKALAGESYRALRTRLMRLQTKRGLRSIIVSSSLPGEGKTLTTMNLGLSYANLAEGSVLIIDGDLRLGGLSKLLGNPPGPGLAEVLTGKSSFEEAVTATDFPRLYAVTAGHRDGESVPELYAGSNWKNFIAWCSESFKVILVDAPSVLPLSDFDLMSAGCDGILLVIRALKTRREVLRRVAGQVDPNKLVGVVYNATEAGNQKPHDQYFGAE